MSKSIASKTLAIAKKREARKLFFMIISNGNFKLALKERAQKLLLDES